MFVSIKFETETGTVFYEPVNLYYITHVRYADVKNPDAGCILVMRDGREHFTVDTMDIVHPMLLEKSAEYGAMVISMVASEQMLMAIDNEERGKVLSKTTRRKRTPKK